MLGFRLGNERASHDFRDSSADLGEILTSEFLGGFRLTFVPNTPLKLAELWKSAPNPFMVYNTD